MKKHDHQSQLARHVSDDDLLTYMLGYNNTDFRIYFRTVASKCTIMISILPLLLNSLARRSEAEALQQFLQDVALARDLSHPHLLRVVGAVISPSDDPIVVMPFMATEDLGSYIREPAKVR